MKETAFNKICGNLSGVDINTVTAEDIITQAKVWADHGNPCTKEIEAAISYLEEIHNNTYLMNPQSGTVQSVSDWQADAKDGGWSMEEAELVEVEQDENGEWTEK